MATISIEGMEFYAHHGCFAEEQTIGTDFRVDIAMDVDTSKAEQTDNLDDTIDYQIVYQLVKREMNIPSKLLEHVGRRIVDAVRTEFPSITCVRLKIRKLNPPLGGKMDSVSVTLESR